MLGIILFQISSLSLPPPFFVPFFFSGCGGLQHILRRGVFGPGRRTVLALLFPPSSEGRVVDEGQGLEKNIFNGSVVILTSHLVQ